MKDFKYKLKYANIWFRRYFDFTHPSILYKRWEDTSIDLDGDVIYGVPRFAFGKNRYKLRKIYVHVIKGYYVFIDGGDFSSDINAKGIEKLIETLEKEEKKNKIAEKYARKFNNGNVYPPEAIKKSMKENMQYVENFEEIKHPS